MMGGVQPPFFMSKKYGRFAIKKAIFGIGYSIGYSKWIFIFFEMDIQNSCHGSRGEI